MELTAVEEPGGYLQWVEYDPPSAYIDSTDSGLQRTATEELLATIKGRMNYEYVNSISSSCFSCVDILRNTKWYSIAGLPNYLSISI